MKSELAEVEKAQLGELMYKAWQRIGPQCLEALQQSETRQYLEVDEVLHVLVDYTFSELPNRNLRDFCLYAPPQELREAVKPYFSAERYSL